MIATRHVLGILLVWLLVPAAGAGARNAPRLRIGDPLPDLVLPRAGSGDRLRLRDLRGRVLAISFFSRYCPPCRKELPVLDRVVERINRRLPPPRKIITLIISVEQLTRGEPPLAGQWLVDSRGRARAAFDPRTFPCTFLVDGKGVVRHINRGFGIGYEARVARWLQRMVSHEQPSRS